MAGDPCWKGGVPPGQPKATQKAEKAARKRRQHVGGQIPRAEVARRSGGFCELGIEGVCRGRADCFHHRLPRSHGGPDTAENLLHVDNLGCHAYAHAHPEESYRKGWILRSTDDLNTPVIGGTRDR